jgi:CDP-diacylglycerol---glycerol-3-phosphate 3-phosphatidyltransferase
MENINMLQNEIFISLLPFILLDIMVIFTITIFAFIYPKRERDKTIPVYTHKTFLGTFLREYGYWFTYPFIYVFIKLKITPNTLTLFSPFLAFISAYLYFTGNFAGAGWVLILSGIMDTLDGRLARLTNQITKEGAYLDSNIDRYSDAIIFGGIALYFRDNLFILIIALLAIVGMEVTSYAKARGEVNGIMTKIGLMQRAERVILLWIVSVFHPFIMLILNRFGITTEYPMIITLILMAILTNQTAIVRIIFIFKEIRKRSAETAG